MSIASLDRISLLSDSLLHEILSFVDIKSVVQTCVLSKRWKTLWIDIPTLNFDFDSYPFEDPTGIAPNSKYSSIKRFIFRVFSDHRCKSIKKLSYSSSIHTDEAALVVELLLCYGRHRQVQELCINTFNTVYFDWPLDLLKSDSLSVLKMTCGFLDNWDDLYSSWLRILEIGYDWDYAPEYYTNRRLEDCPSLESLVLVNCRFESASIDTPELQSFELSFSSSSEWDRFPKLELLTPNLKRVKFCNVLPIVNSNSNSDFSCIQEVNIALDNDDSDFDGDGLAMQYLTWTISHLLRVFHNARSFTLPLKAMEGLLSDTSSLSSCSFPNLRYLKLKTDATSKTISLPITTLMNSLNCPNLEMLDFEVDHNQREHELSVTMRQIKEKLEQVEARTTFELARSKAEVAGLKEMLKQIMDSQGGTSK